jgi:hypothetical protein
LVQVRMERQELLFDRSSGPLLFFIFDEAVIHRLVGEKDLRLGQLTRLIEMATKPGVTIEILPFSTGIHRGLIEDFSILEFEGDDSDVLYFEGARMTSFTRDETEEITLYRELFEEMRTLSLGPEGTRDFLVDVVDKIR